MASIQEQKYEEVLVDGKKKFKCGICKRLLSRRDYILQHLSRDHLVCKYPLLITSNTFFLLGSCNIFKDLAKIKKSNEIFLLPQLTGVSLDELTLHILQTNPTLSNLHQANYLYRMM